MVSDRFFIFHMHNPFNIGVVPQEKEKYICWKIGEGKMEHVSDFILKPCFSSGTQYLSI